MYHAIYNALKASYPPVLSEGKWFEVKFDGLIINFTNFFYQRFIWKFGMYKDLIS